MKSLIHEMLICENVSYVIVKPLLHCYSKIIVDPTARVNQLVEIISDIREPIATVESSVSQEEQRKLDLKVCNTTHMYLCCVIMFNMTVG